MNAEAKQLAVFDEKNLPDIDETFLQTLVAEHDEVQQLIADTYTRNMLAWALCRFNVKALSAGLDVGYGVEKDPNSDSYHKHLQKLIDTDQKETCTAYWLSLEDKAGLKRFMNQKQMSEFHSQATDNPPPFTMSNIMATLGGRYKNAKQTFVDGLMDFFQRTAGNHKYKRNSPFKFGKTVRIERVTAGWNTYGQAGLVYDLEKKIAVLHGAPTPEHSVVDVIKRGYERKWDGSTDYIEPGTHSGPWFDCRWYKNGNMLITMPPKTRRLLNRVIADVLGAVVPDDTSRGPSRDYNEGDDG